MIGNVSRRDLLRSGTSAVALVIVAAPFVAPALASASPSLDEFIAVSRKVTGQSSLDGGMGKNILAAFISAGQGGDIAALIADPATGGSEMKIANAVVAAWYSGLSPLPGAREVTGFNEALVWNALTYTKPWGSCGGETGYWSETPPGEEP